MYDLIIRNGTIVDGTGAKPFVGDVAINGDRIVLVGTIVLVGALLFLPVAALGPIAEHLSFTTN